MKIILSLLILLALIGSVRYVTNKPGPVDQELIAKIGDKMDETLSGAVATGTVVDTTANTVASGTTTSGDTTTTTTPTPTAGDTYIISAGSTLGWIGRKVGGEHTGAIAIKSATATVADGKLVGGEVVIDMNTITVIDLPAGEMNDKLV